MELVPELRIQDSLQHRLHVWSERMLRPAWALTDSMLWPYCLNCVTVLKSQERLGIMSHPRQNPSTDEEATT